MKNSINLYQHRDAFLRQSFDDIIIKIARSRREDQVKSILFCGSEPGVGTTTVAINLAITLSQSKWRTLLIDSDMRKEARHKHLSDTPRMGLSDYLSGQAGLDDIIYETNSTGLDYIPCGQPTEHSVRLISSLQLERLHEAVCGVYDFILLDSPSLNAANDAVALSLVADSAILVVDLDISTKDHLLKIKQSLGNVKRGVMGVVVNKVNKIEYRAYMNHYDYFKKERYLQKSAGKFDRKKVAHQGTTSPGQKM